MNDIDAVIDAAKHFKFHENDGVAPLNRLSSCPESKKHLKRAIKERMQLLAAAYVSLATFVPDEDADVLEQGADKDKMRDILLRVDAEMEKLRSEMAAFDPLVLPTRGRCPDTPPT
jgi:hypothetical protein